MPDTAPPEVCIADGVVRLSVDTRAGPVEIFRIADHENCLTGEWAHTSRPAPSALLQPLVPVAGVVQLGELELIEALRDADIVVADGRKPEQSPDTRSPARSICRSPRPRAPSSQLPLRRGWLGLPRCASRGAVLQWRLLRAIARDYSQDDCSRLSGRAHPLLSQRNAGLVAAGLERLDAGRNRKSSHLTNRPGRPTFCQPFSAGAGCLSFITALSSRTSHDAEGLF